MQTMTRQPFNSSVMYSLAEVTRMEEERLQEEARRLAKARDDRERELREADAARRRAEKAKLAAEEAARRQREREAAEAHAIAQARAKAVIEAARIEAENKARSKADEADREHQLAVLRVRSESGARRLRRALTMVLAMTFLGGGLASFRVVNERAESARETERLRSDVTALSQELTRVKSDGLAALDRRYAELRSRPLIREASAALTSAEEARKTIDEKNVDTTRLSSFRGTLNQLEERIDAAHRLATLDRRYDDLTTWASQYTARPEVALALTAANRAKEARSSDPSTVQAYERSLDRLRKVLAHGSSSSTSTSSSVAARPVDRRGSSSSTGAVASPSTQCRQGDPLCDLRGHSL